jgi:hypothetical protein
MEVWIVRQEDAEARIPQALRGAEGQQLFALDVEHARYRHRCFFHSEGERARWHHLLRDGNASFKMAHRLAARNSLLATHCKRDAQVWVVAASPADRVTALSA